MEGSSIFSWLYTNACGKMGRKYLVSSVNIYMYIYIVYVEFFQWPQRLGFNSRLSYTKDSKNAT